MRPELLLLFLGAPAQAWDLNGADWSWQSSPLEDPLYLAEDSFPDAEVDPEDVREAVNNAMSVWNEAGYDVSLHLGDEIVDAAQDPEGVFVILHGEQEDMGAALAFTAIWSYADGLAFDCDVMYLDADDEGDIVWSADPAGAADGSWDVESVALHELGHCLGLSHSDDEDAIMYAHYTGARTLGADDLDGLAQLYPPACADLDGDGFTDCEGDCEDGDAGVSPAALEVCDGRDDNCNGALDEVESEPIVLGDDQESADWSEESVGNGFIVDSATTLRSLRQRWEGPEGARLVWSVSVLEEDGTWSMVATVRGEAEAGEWQQSPALDLPLEAGRTYAVVLGTVFTGVTMYYQKRPNLDPVGAITPLGSLYGRGLGDQIGEPDDRYLVHQELYLTAPEDPETICEDTGGAGETGETGADSGSPDTGPGGELPKIEGCACAQGGGPASSWLGWLALGLVGLRRRARPRWPAPPSRW